MSKDTLQTGYMSSAKELHVSERSELRSTLREPLWTQEQQSTILKVITGTSRDLLLILYA